MWNSTEPKLNLLSTHRPRVDLNNKTNRNHCINWQVARPIRRFTFSIFTINYIINWLFRIWCCVIECWKAASATTSIAPSRILILNFGCVARMQLTTDNWTFNWNNITEIEIATSQNYHSPLKCREREKKNHFNSISSLSFVKKSSIRRKKKLRSQITYRVF